MVSNKKKRKSQSSCLDRIVSLVNYRERCSKELYSRLVIQENYSKEEFNKALSLAKNYNLVDDERYAEFYINDKFEQYRGSYYIEKHLENMDIDISNNKYLVDIKLKEEKKAYEYLKYHKPTSKNAYQSTLKKLLSRGYPYDIAIKVTNNYIDNLL